MVNMSSLWSDAIEEWDFYEKIPPPDSLTLVPLDLRIQQNSKAWNAHDDNLLLHAVRNECIDKNSGEVQAHGAWARVAQIIKNSGKATTERTQMACRARYVEHLRPGLRTDKMSHREKYTLLLALEKINEKAGLPITRQPPQGTWSRLVGVFPGRTQLDLRNVFNILNRKPKSGKKRTSTRFDYRIVAEREYDPWGTDDEIWSRLSAKLSHVDAALEEKKRVKRRERMDKRNQRLRTRRRARQSDEAMSEDTLQQIYHNFERDHIETGRSEYTDVDLEDLLWLETHVQLQQYARALRVKIRKSNNKDDIVLSIYNAIILDETKIRALMNMINEKYHGQYSFTALEGSQEVTTTQKASCTPGRPSQKRKILVSPSRT